MLITTEYAAVRDRMRAGDVIAFSGSGFISAAIKLLTRSCVSHVGIVFEILQTDRRRVKLMESTSLGGIDGVQETYLSERLAGYRGPMWWLPLSDASRRKMDAAKFWATLYTCKGRKYDYRQVLHFAVDLLNLWAQGESPGRLFCSELAALALKAAYVLPVWIDSSEIRPVDLCAMRIYSENYYQIKGRTQAIKRYNRKDPLQWRN